MFDSINLGEDILFYLRNRHVGTKNVITSSKIEEIFGISSVMVRHTINKLRCDGQPICSNSNGYYYAENHDEINDTVSRLLKRIKKITNATNGLVVAHQIFDKAGRDDI